MELLLAFYWPEGDKQHPIARLLSPKGVKQRTLAYVLFIAARQILSGNPERKGQDIEEQITAAMEKFWMQERSAQGHHIARGENLEAVRPRIQAYAHSYYQGIFSEGERSIGKAASPVIIQAISRSEPSSVKSGEQREASS
jgi:hypothetical protein